METKIILNKLTFEDIKLQIISDTNCWSSVSKTFTSVSQGNSVTTSRRRVVTYNP